MSNKINSPQIQFTLFPKYEPQMFPPLQRDYEATRKKDQQDETNGNSMRPYFMRRYETCGGPVMKPTPSAYI
jgi:hypothetical protein